MLVREADRATSSHAAAPDALERFIDELDASVRLLQQRDTELAKPSGNDTLHNAAHATFAQHGTAWTRLRPGSPAAPIISESTHACVRTGPVRRTCTGTRMIMMPKPTRAGMPRVSIRSASATAAPSRA